MTRNFFFFLNMVCHRHRVNRVVNILIPSRENVLHFNDLTSLVTTNQLIFQISNNEAGPLKLWLSCLG